MRPSLLASNYIATDSILHDMYPGAKLVLLILYAVALFTRGTAEGVLAFLIFMLFTTWALGLPVSGRFGFFAAILLLISIFIIPSSYGLLTRLILAFVKIVTLNIMIALFNMTTKLSELLAMLAVAQRFGKQIRYPVLSISVMVTVAPIVYRDLNRAIDAETLRRGSSPRIFSLGSWATILAVALARILKRAERLTDAIIDRGYSPENQIISFDHRPARWHDLVIAGLLIIPALGIVFLTL